MYGVQAKTGSMRPCEKRMFEHGMICVRGGQEGYECPLGDAAGAEASVASVGFV